jgi:CubicO group peptidase (beta-lactamase class C family)
VRRILTLLIICLLLYATPLFADDELIDNARTATIEFLMENAISHGLITGSVIMVGNRDGILYTAARGRLTPAADSPLLNERTMFDIASLTKVFATTPAIMKLLDEGRITLTDPLTRWFPELDGTGREDVTILNLLTHTSGFNDVSFGADEPLKTAIRKIATQKGGRLPGNRFHYADINFILLGELVRRVSGTTLDRFCQEQFYGPLGMNDTMFLPPRERMPTIAPTYGLRNELLSGIVQDENARLLGGVAGHAGLFSSGADLARFVLMMLNNGMLDGRYIFPERVVAQMTAPYFYSNGHVVRGLGWDILSPYSAPKGSIFSEMSFGHTGYSGSSIWIDPQRDLFVILLTTRLDYRDIRLFNRLRSDISTLAAAVFLPYGKRHARAETLQSP